MVILSMGLTVVPGNCTRVGAELQGRERGGASDSCFRALNE